MCWWVGGWSTLNVWKSIVSGILWPFRIQLLVQSSLTLSRWMCERLWLWVPEPAKWICHSFCKLGWSPLDSSEHNNHTHTVSIDFIALTKHKASSIYGIVYGGGFGIFFCQWSWYFAIDFWGESEMRLSHLLGLVLLKLDESQLDPAKS